MENKELTCSALKNGHFIRSDGVSHLCCALSMSSEQIARNRISLETQNFEDFFEGNPLIKDIEGQLSSGVFPLECFPCEKREKNGDRSLRLRSGEKWGDEDSGLKTFNIELGNICNLQCVYCSSTYSSKWVKDSDIHDVFNITHTKEPQNSWLKNEGLWKAILKRIENSPEFQTLEIVGGEPFLSPANDFLLESLIAKNLHKKIEVVYSSNLSMVSEKQLELLKEFSKVEILFSVDSLNPKRFSYIRNLGNLSECLNNFYLLRNHNILVRPYFTIHALNVLDLPELFRWSQREGITPSFGVVHYPNFFHPSSLATEIREKVVSELATEKVPRSEQLIKQLEGPKDLENYKELKRFLNLLDERRGLDHKDFLPELED